jgi:hypothetical protein
VSESDPAAQPGEPRRRQRITERCVIGGFLLTVVALYVVIGYGVYVAVDAIL